MSVTLGEACSKRILDLCKEHNISLNKLSIMCGITQSTLNNITSGTSRNPTISTVKKICDGLEIPLSIFFDTKDFDEAEPEIK